MIRATHAGALLLALTMSLAGAQNLSAYRDLASNLDQAARLRAGTGSKSAEQALLALDRAAGAYTKLAPTLQNKQLAGGLSAALEDARAALARTPAELQAQVLLGRGLMRKALYDQTLAGLAQAPAGNTAQLNLLAREFAISGAAARALSTDAKAGRLERVAWRLQRVAAQKVNTALRATPPRRTAAAYLSLAQATSWFTVVQDAGGAQSLRVSQFTDALRQLTTGDVPALSTSLSTLRQGAATFQRSLASPPTGQGKAGSVTTGPRPPVTAPTGQPGAGTQTPDTQPGTQTASPQNPGTRTGQAGSAAGEASGASGETPVGAAGSVAAAYAALGRALAATGHGDVETGRAELGRLGTVLGRLPAALKTAPGYDGLVRDVEAMQSRRGLRPDDVQALISRLGNLERASASAADNFSAGAARTFGGGTRALVFLLLGLLSLAPLYLLNLAFGGRNTYWRAISVALTLLLLPTLLEGLFGFLGWLGDLTGIGALRGGLNLTPWQGAYGPALHALLTLIAIGLATYGFHGLCVQFGLLGQRKAATAPQTSREWDEEV